jgi:hypothetical protein
MPTARVFYNFESVDMISIGPGDADVVTKSGRHTEVLVDIQVPQVDEANHRLRTHLIYRIKEGRHDYTTLELNRDVYIPVPTNWKNITLPGLTAFRLETVYFGQNHRWNDISVNWLDSFMSLISVKIDGKGDEDKDGNAGIRIVFYVPVEYTLA